ncbi:MAG: FHA domain-containing protein, partial [Deltaproteobacteria bacterium]|nr:FHA domain-containing protein [Deltaproteobacteria bacterium]
EKLGAFERKGDVTLADSSISRLHAMIFYDDLGVGILDLVSKNGTFVNGAEVESRLLQKGDVVLLGSTKLKLE